MSRYTAYDRYTSSPYPLLKLKPKPLKHFPNSRAPFLTIAMATSQAKDDKSSGSGKSVAIVGGGVSGLTAAYKLKSKGVKVILFESEGYAGGKIRSNSENGFLWDEGANTMTESEKEVGRLIDELNIRDKQQFPLSQHKRYIVRNGKPELIPSDPISLIKSSILSTQSKLKLLMEPFMWRSSDQKSSAKVSDEYSKESVRSFFQRHFGKEVVDYLIDPFVAGTSGGDPDSLYMPYAFPELWDLEKKYGSIIAGAILSKLKAKSSDKGEKNTSVKKRNTRASFSFHGGMQVLIDSLSKEVGGDNLKLNSKVLSLAYNYEAKSPSGTWSIACDTRNPGTKDITRKQSFDAVIMTAPVSSVQEMKFSLGRSPFVLDFLPKVSYLPFSLLVTAFKKESVQRPLEGFGVLVPSIEQKNGLKTLGTLFSSMMFPDRAPSDQYLYTTFIGGSRNRDLAGAPLHVLKEMVTADLKKLLGAEGEPTFIKHIHWKNAFPLYDKDYNLVLEAIGKMEKSLPGFFYAGNNKDGLAVGKAITSGSKVAELVMSYLDNKS
ncbi:Protoporphyrinogen oxidase [Rhynchospora pubera]|uniref:Protoporphyrinogen oxidase n=1 Tax=Rhynchospora pubera TaxID=906938 RepID=A0AAV8FIE0_9POAL|nr:Protoporphyrinogen oxidase [Rhynchospora pubera]